MGESIRPRPSPGRAGALLSSSLIALVWKGSSRRPGRPGVGAEPLCLTHRCVDPQLLPQNRRKGRGSQGNSGLCPLPLVLAPRWSPQHNPRCTYHSACSRHEGPLGSGTPRPQPWHYSSGKKLKCKTRREGGFRDGVEGLFLLSVPRCLPGASLLEPLSILLTLCLFRGRRGLQVSQAQLGSLHGGGR